MDSLITFFKKNSAATVVVVLLLPIGVALLYSSIKAIWFSRRSKTEVARIYDFLLGNNAYEKAFTNEEISKATGVPKDRVIEHCANHDNIEDAGKRQRSWKLGKDNADEKKA